MPISINVWVPARDQSRDSCDHYKVVSNCGRGGVGRTLGRADEAMKFVCIGLVFRDSSHSFSMLGGTTSPPNRSFPQQNNLLSKLSLLSCFLVPASSWGEGLKAVFLEQVEKALSVHNCWWPEKIQLYRPMEELTRPCQEGHGWQQVWQVSVISLIGPQQVQMGERWTAVRLEEMSGILREGFSCRKDLFGGNWKRFPVQ